MRNLIITFIAISITLFSCSNQENDVEVVNLNLRLKIMKLEVDYPLILGTLKKNKDVVVMSSTVFKDKISMYPSGPDLKSLDSYTKNAKPVRTILADFSFESFQLMPYYGQEAYTRLNYLRKYDHQHLMPECPLDVKYLALLVIDDAHNPILGCVF